MKIKRILLVTLAALAFGLAAFGGAAPVIAGGRGGLGGDFPSGPGRTLVAPQTLIAAGRGVLGGDF